MTKNHELFLEHNDVSCINKDVSCLTGLTYINPC